MVWVFFGLFFSCVCPSVGSLVFFLQPVYVDIYFVFEVKRYLFYLIKCGVCLAGGRESGAEGLYGADTKKRNACKGVGAQRQEWAAPAHGHHHHLPPPTSVHMAAVLDPALPASSPPPFLPHPLLPTHPPFLISHSPLDSHDFRSVCSLTASKPSRPPLLVGITDT